MTKQQFLHFLRNRFLKVNENSTINDYKNQKLKIIRITSNTKTNLNIYN